MNGPKVSLSDLRAMTPDQRRPYLEAACTPEMVAHYNNPRGKCPPPPPPPTEPNPGEGPEWLSWAIGAGVALNVGLWTLYLWGVL